MNIFTVKAGYDWRNPVGFPFLKEDDEYGRWYLSDQVVREGPPNAEEI